MKIITLQAVVTNVFQLANMVYHKEITHALSAEVIPVTANDVQYDFVAHSLGISLPQATRVYAIIFFLSKNP